MNLFTRDNITLALSIFGTIGTISTWLYNYIKSRKKFTVDTNGYLLNPKGLLVHVQFVNKSALPLSINDISLSIDGAEYRCAKIPEKVFETTHHVGKEIRSHNEYFSMDFPINLAPLCGSSGYLYFSSGKENFPRLSNDVTAIIRTNRGREAQKTLLLQNLLS